MKQYTIQINAAYSLTEIIVCLDGMIKLVNFSKIEKAQIMTAVSEIVMNVIKHADYGIAYLRVIEKNSNKGIEVIIEDKGSGLEDIDQVMQDHYSTTRTLGLGLPGAKRLIDEFEIESKVGIGTKVRLVHWKKNAI